MPSKVYPDILEALGLDAETSKMVTHGGSQHASTFKLTGTDKNGESKTFFVKTGSGKDAAIMFRGEHASLNAIHSAVPDFCPRSIAHGALSDSSSRYFLATEFLDLSGGRPASGRSLAAKLAQMHTTPAPVPRDRDGPSFGFPVSTCCGPTVQCNGWRTSWADFYAENRLKPILDTVIRAHGRDDDLEALVEDVALKVVPRLLGKDTLKDVVPVVVHGDLWGGNHGQGRVVGSGEGEGGVEEMVFDPSCVYGHSEYELGIMQMFGGFGGAFWDEYARLVPKSEPVEEFEDRVALYELYHHLNHFAIFGRGYKAGAVAIMRRLINKYVNRNWMEATAAENFIS